MKTKKFKLRRIAGTLVFVIAAVTAQFSAVNLVHATGPSTDVWVGGGGNNNFSTAANWQADTVPVSGDTIKFTPLSTGTDGQDINLTNDLSGVAFAGVIAAPGATGNGTYYYINTITLADGATLSEGPDDSVIASVSFGVDTDTISTGTITANGNLTVISGFWSGVFHVAGYLAANGTASVSLSPGSSVSGALSGPGYIGVGSTPPASGDLVTLGDINLPDADKALVFSGPTQTISSNMTIGAFDSSILNQLAFGDCATGAGGGLGSSPAPVTVTCGTYAPATFTLSGTITLNADLVIDVASQSDVKFTGTINDNGHTISLTQDSLGTLELPDGSGVTTSAVTTNLSDDQPDTSYTVQNKETAILDGTRSLVTVGNGGTLKGTGTAANVYVSPGGTVAPGHSPGKLTVLESLDIEGTYEAELKDATAGDYDQIQVGDSSQTTGQDVSLGSDASLNVSLYSGWKIKAGDKFTIIDNRQPATQLVNGTFNGLAEGAHLTAGGITFSISYVGGDGNDVVLTALSSGHDPSAPNTGVQLLGKASPYAVVVLGVASAMVLFVIRRNLALKKR